MKRLVTLLMAASLTVVLCACSNPLKTATDVVENTTETTVVLEDPSVLPSFIIYDANDNTQIALTLGAVYADWHYLDSEGNEQTITSTDTSSADGTTDGTLADASADAAADPTADASGDAASADTTAGTEADTATDASGDAASADAASAGGTEAILAAAYLSLPTLDVDDDSEIYYVIDPGATPDRMEQTSWKSEYIGDESADAMEIYIKLASFNSLPLKADRVYQVDVTWDAENYESVGYYGTLTYMFVTE